MHVKVTAVIVSYNREELLAQCLDGIHSQTYPIERVIVVDNASSDNSVQVARTHSCHPEVIELHSNVGGAGGFCAGIAQAVATALKKSMNEDHTVHYVWLMDDDTVPLPTALEELVRAVDASVTANNALPTVLGSKAIWTDGREHLMNKPRPRAHCVKGLEQLPGFDQSYQVRSLSFVSCFINIAAIVGLRKFPQAAYFLWNDDYEYTTALLRRGFGYYIPQSVVMHKTKVFGSSDADPGERFYYEVRNKIWLLRFSRSNFSGIGVAAFLAKTLRRWILTYMRSHDKTVIRNCFTRGWHDGWYTDPQSNAQVLHDNSSIASLITIIERG